MGAWPGTPSREVVLLKRYGESYFPGLLVPNAVLGVLTNLQGATDATSIQWGPCDPSLVTNPSLSCGFFEIPLDYNDSSVGKGRIAVIKANATGDRLGTFSMNPG